MKDRMEGVDTIGACIEVVCSGDLHDYHLAKKRRIVDIGGKLIVS